VIPSNERQPAVRVRVLYADTDAAGVVYNAAYLRFLEAGRAEAMRTTGSSYPMLVQQGFHLPVVELQVRYRNPAVYDDVLEVFVSVSQLRRVQVTFEYEVRRESDDCLILNARTTHACVDVARLRLAAFPDWARDCLRLMQASSRRAE
jgi:acyl-CoA thioester hydrolase